MKTEVKTRYNTLYRNNCLLIFYTPDTTPVLQLGVLKVQVSTRDVHKVSIPSTTIRVIIDLAIHSERTLVQRCFCAYQGKGKKLLKLLTSDSTRQFMTW